METLNKDQNMPMIILFAGKVEYFTKKNICDWWVNGGTVGGCQTCRERWENNLHTWNLILSKEKSTHSKFSKLRLLLYEIWMRE